MSNQRHNLPGLIVPRALADALIHTHPMRERLNSAPDGWEDDMFAGLLALQQAATALEDLPCPCCEPFAWLRVIRARWFSSKRRGVNEPNL